MRKERVHKLIPEVSRVTGFKEEVIKEVIQAHYDALQEFLNNPTHAAIHFDFFGKFYTKPSQVKLRINRLVKEYRLEPTQAKKDEISSMYSIYRKAHEYEQSRKYKKRFGSWHYK